MNNIETENPTIDPQPAETTIPQAVRVTRKINGKTWLAGVGSRNAKIAFIVPVPSEEEAAEEKVVGYGKTIPRTPRMLESPAAVIFSDLALREGIDMAECFYVPMVRYLPESPKHRTKPPKTAFRECWPALETDLKEIKPDIVVCLGKQVFDEFVTFKVKEDDIMGAWFFNERFQCLIYPMPHISKLIKKPEIAERFSLDLRTVKNMHETRKAGGKVEQEPINITVVRNSYDLHLLVARLMAERHTVLSVDCEWEGHQHVDGQLRSLQIAWDGYNGAYIRFMDDNLNYVFDVSYEEAGKILAEWLDRPEVKYIGHHVSADLSWMHHWLKLQWYNKAIFDSEFAYQTCDEGNDLGLDALALRFTDFGKYDWDLIWYLKTHPDRKGNGYGRIPDDIMIPYAVKDTLVVHRAYPVIYADLVRQKLDNYYNNILNPFVTDVFTSFCLRGLPVNRAKMDEMRVLYNWAKEELQKDFQALIAREAEELLRNKLEGDFGQEGLLCFLELQEMALQGRTDTIRSHIQKTIGPGRLAEYEPFIGHYLVSPAFNIRSKPQMTRWLYQVKGYTPIKTTANKAAGMPSISWEKVLEYPPARQATFTPATDTPSLKILAARYADKTIRSLLELNAVGNICKAFLKPADITTEDLYDPETGETVEIEKVKENGLHYWIASDECAHVMTSCTETGRPRS